MGKTLEIFMDNRSRKTVIITSIILLLVGIVSIVLPQFMSMAIALFVGWLMIIAGSIAFYITWYGFRDRWVVWLKTFVLVAVGLLILFYPITGAAALGLLLAICFLLIGFASVAFALDVRPWHGWGWLIFNGVLSLLLAILFIAGWPLTSTWLVGMFIGIGLFIEGLSLLMLGISAKIN